MDRRGAVEQSGGIKNESGGVDRLLTERSPYG